jgi:hypothetical protein
MRWKRLQRARRRNESHTPHLKRVGFQAMPKTVDVKPLGDVAVLYKSVHIIPIFDDDNG